MRRIRYDLIMRGVLWGGDDTFGMGVRAVGCGDIVNYSDEGINAKL